jgi:excisionase family DNA binding protein
VAKSKSGEFYTFDEVLRQLNIDENRLKRLVSEGEIRAFREGDQMKFKRGEIDNLAGRSGRSGSGDTSLSEISLEDEPAPKKKGGRAGETLTDDLLSEPDLTKRAGMKTAEISSQDTFIDQGGGDVGMSTEPIDFTESEGEEAEEIGAGVSPTKKAGGAAAARKPTSAPVEAHTSGVMVAVLCLTSLLAICAGLVTIAIAKQRSDGVSRKFAEMFGPEPVKAPVAAQPAAGDTPK